MDPSLTNALTTGIWILSGYIVLNMAYTAVALFGQVHESVKTHEQTKLLKEALSKTVKPSEGSGWIGKPPTGVQ